ncbi:MAG: porin [Bryobacterales bacterium]|nr:porin [Bryobacterales bacterium]
MKPLKCVCAGAALLGSALAAQAQTAAPSPWSAGPLTFSGLMDGYYSLGFNHPASRTNQLRNFDVQANRLSLNMAKLTLEHAPDPVGVRIDLGFGRAFDIVHSSERDLAVMRNIEQVFVSVKPKQAKGFQADFGKFVTSAGAEVIGTNSNWNYSRSLLFSWAIPYYHFGLRTSMPLHKYFTAGVQLVNGWNNVRDNNSGKTVGLTGVLATSKVTWSHTYYLGPEKLDSNRGYRRLYDTTLLLTPHPKMNFYLNVDYGAERRISRGSDTWKGIAGAARFAPKNWLALSPRLEWFSDADGFATGTPQSLKEFTLTAEFKIREGILMRPEYRRDWSDRPFFDRGASTGVHKSQDTLLAGIVAYFGPKR